MKYRELSRNISLCFTVQAVKYNSENNNLNSGLFIPSAYKAWMQNNVTLFQTMLNDITFH